MLSEIYIKNCILLLILCQKIEIPKKIIDKNNIVILYYKNKKSPWRLPCKKCMWSVR